MLSRWRRRNTSDSVLRQPDSINPSFVERKIHPDLNSLAEELASSSQGHSRDSQDRVSEMEGQESLEPGMAGFVGLRPSTRSRRSQKEAYIEHDTGLTEAESEHIEAYRYTLHQDQKEAPQESTSNSSPPYPPNTIRPGDQSTGTAGNPIMRWSTFGRRSRLRHFDADVGGRSISITTTHSSLSQYPSVVTYPSDFPSPDQPATPGSQTHSLYTSTPLSRSTSSRNHPRDPDIPSPHTFGMATPPLPQSVSAPDESFFTFKEIPPPLPPLDHPAFQNASNTIALLPSRHEFPKFPDVDEHGRFTRHTHSLPSLTRSRSTSTRTGSMKSTPKDTRPRSKSSATGNFKDKKDQLHSEATMNSLKLRTHSRNQSKSSIASSRRSSAEYSAKQASSIGHERIRDNGCWEVQVSKEMIRLALGGSEEGQRVDTNAATTRDANASSFGRARGKNWWTGEASRLGSPFFLQGPASTTLSHNLTDNQGSNDNTARIKSNTGRNVPSTVSENNLRHDDMSHGGSMIPPTGSSASHITRKARESTGEGSPSPSGSQSRRGGARATSTPFSQPSKLDTAPHFGSMQDQSTLLAPPSLSVTSPTPEASPISPSRRTHAKSSPTMPTTSVLRTPSTPPVIEKSHSSGSGKRKADDAGFGGDKTPPKENKEPRATFAPEPRTHRASATSGSSGHAPSSFNRSKRVRLANSSEVSSRAGTLPTPDDSPPNAKSTGSWSSRGSHGPLTGSSHTYGPPPATSASHASHYSNSNTQHAPNRPPSRRSLSQASIPISALISPHAPSITRGSTFHMRDPRKPAPVQSTPWTLSWPSHVQEGESRWAWRGWEERGGSPLHAWLFFIGFILFPLWWAAALFIPIPKTRRLGGTDAEKAVMLDDPQVEHDAKSWRTRCRAMAAVSLITYIPFIVLVAIFA